MNGRCETDPFDRAVDICRICYGEFCWTCLVETKGRTQPMCRECALIVGGLRPKAKPRIRGSKKTVKARREALREAREAPRHHGANFTFFDVGDDHNFVGFQDLGSSRATQKPEPVSDAPPPEVKESPAVQRLDSIRRADRQGSPDADQFVQDDPAVSAAPSPPPPPLPGQTPMPATADGEQFTLETYTPEPEDRNPVASDPARDQTAPAAYQPSPGLSGAAPIGHEPPPPPTSGPPPPGLSSVDASEEAMPVGYEPPPWEALAAPSDLAQMKPASADNREDNTSGSYVDDEPSDDDDLNFDEPAEFRKPRPFVTAAQPAAVSTAPAASAAPPAQEPAETSHVDPAQTAAPATPAVRDEKPAPISGQPNATPPAEFAIAAVGRSERDEPVHIHDDPWARTGPEVVSTAPLPKRRPDPKPSEDASTSPPDWTKAKLPKFD